jgi:hypothetical protein
MVLEGFSRRAKSGFFRENYDGEAFTSHELSVGPNGSLGFANIPGK